MLKEDRINAYQDKIIIFYKQRRRMPSYSEIQKLTHYRSKSGVVRLIDKLEQRRFLKRDRGGKLVPGFSFFSIPFPGTVQAGFPSPADQGYEDQERIDLYSYLVKKPADTFIHQVTGDSMINVGIYDGDLVISERTSDLPIGKIVIAEVNGSCTIKRLQQNQSGQIYLQPENDDHKKIYADDGQEITVLAIVRSVMRQFDK
jgi:repressor LexA